MVTVRPSAAVLAHGFADAGPLPVALPLLVAGAVAVALAGTLLPRRAPSAIPPAAAALRGGLRAAVLAVVAVVGVAIVVPAAFGPSDVAANPAPRLLFTVGWAGVVVTSVLLGPWWPRASPLRALTGTRDSGAASTLAPAAAAVAVFGAFEQVLDPSPLVALLAVALYAVGGLVVAAVGAGPALAATDPVEAVSSALGSLTPLGRRDGPAARSPRAGAAAHPAAPGLAALLGALVGMNLVDALEPGGGLGVRAAVYVAVVAGTALLFHAAARPGFLAVALIPAAAGHLGAHYLAPLLLDTQIAAVLASDPLGRGWNLLGLTGAEIAAEPISPLLGQWLQLALLVAGHAVALAVAADVATARLDRRRAAAVLFPVRAVVLASLVAGVLLRLGGLG